jgi:hypothetical protein
VTAGTHTLTLENPRGPGWFDFSSLDLGMEIPALGAIGRRNESVMVAWIWHRANIFSPTPSAAPAAGQLILRDVPPGRWRIAWFDTTSGAFLPTREVDHQGGNLVVPTPLVARQAALLATRIAK